VEASSLQVAPGEIEQLATAVRVAGPALTWIRDTATRPGCAPRHLHELSRVPLRQSFRRQADFNRLDLSNSSYYSFDKGRFVLARNTRYGQERAFGSAGTELIPLLSGFTRAGHSLRGFGENGAGPRDPETGYPSEGGRAHQ